MITSYLNKYFRRIMALINSLYVSRYSASAGGVNINPCSVGFALPNFQPVAERSPQGCHPSRYTT